MIIIVENKEDFGYDLDIELTLNGLNSGIVVVNSIKQLADMLGKNVQVDKIVVNSAAYSSDFNKISIEKNIPLRIYSVNNNDFSRSKDINAPTYGITSYASELIEKISSDKYTYNPVVQRGNASKGVETPKRNTVDSPVSEVREKVSCSEQAVKDDNFLKRPDVSVDSEKKTEDDNSQEITLKVSDTEASYSNTLLSEKSDNSSNEENPGTSSLDYYMSAMRNGGLRNLVAAGNTAEDEVNYDTGAVKKPAKLITVISAKGGVGKTRISCELATYLALTKHRRGHFKVCLVDYNVDFGDVVNTLGFDRDKSSMAAWAADIRERVKAGENPENMEYSEQRISVLLQKKEKDGLYALLAPFRHIDSFAISPVEFEVMLRNIVKNGGFDYVVVDTGNNTRDSFLISASMSDYMLMILTQDFNCINCNYEMVFAMKKLLPDESFDTSKIKVVVNKAIESRKAGMSPDDVMSIINTNNKTPYELISVIKEDSDVIAAGNNATPLCYNAEHSFTKSIGSIVAKIVGNETALSAPVKNDSLFDRIKKTIKKLFNR